MGAASFSFVIQLLEHCAVWLEDLLEMSHNSDNTIHLRIRVTYYYLWDDPPIFETTQQEPAKSEG